LAAGFCSKNSAFARKIMALPVSGGASPSPLARTPICFESSWWTLPWSNYRVTELPLFSGKDRSFDTIQACDRRTDAFLTASKVLCTGS